MCVIATEWLCLRQTQSNLISSLVALLFDSYKFVQVAHETLAQHRKKFGKHVLPVASRIRFSLQDARRANVVYKLLECGERRLEAHWKLIARQPESNMRNMFHKDVILCFESTSWKREDDVGERAERCGKRQNNRKTFRFDFNFLFRIFIGRHFDCVKVNSS